MSKLVIYQVDTTAMLSKSYAYLEEIINASDPEKMRYRIASIPDPDLDASSRIEPNDVVDSFPNIYIHCIDAQRSNPT